MTNAYPSSHPLVRMPLFVLNTGIQSPPRVDAVRLSSVDGSRGTGMGRLMSRDIGSTLEVLLVDFPFPPHLYTLTFTNETVHNRFESFVLRNKSCSEIAWNDALRWSLLSPRCAKSLRLSKNQSCIRNVSRCVQGCRGSCIGPMQCSTSCLEQRLDTGWPVEEISLPPCTMEANGAGRDATSRAFQIRYMNQPDETAKRGLHFPALSLTAEDSLVGI